MKDLRGLRAEYEERERLLESLREQIYRDEQKLRELDKSMEEVRRDIHALKQTIEYLRNKFTP